MIIFQLQIFGRSVIQAKMLQPEATPFHKLWTDRKDNSFPRMDIITHNSVFVVLRIVVKAR